MNNKGIAVQWIILIVLAIILMGIGIYIAFDSGNQKKNLGEVAPSIPTEKPVQSANNEAISNLSYVVESKSIKLVNGKADNISISGNPIQGDLTGDGTDDSALILTSTVNNKKVYYITTAVKKDNEYEGINAISLPVDLEPKAVTIKEGIIIVSYVERSESDPIYDRMATAVTNGYAVEDGVLKELPAAVVAEKGCIASGGTVGTAFCCTSSKDFSNNCLIGACGCAPMYSKEFKACQCPENKCFNGNECVVQ